MPAEPEFLHTQTLIIGSGISGLFLALKLAAAGRRSLIVSKNALGENNSRYAQGGIAAFFADNADDSLDLHVRDTLAAGAGLCDPLAVREILADGADAIADLLSLGVPFDADAEGRLELTLEGGHSARRIIHAGGDATGQQVEMTLIDRVREHPLIEALAFCEATALLSDGRRCYGCDAHDFENQRSYRIFADAVVLATGGGGRLYSRSTNPPGATGNGFWLAYQAGAELRDMEFVQFHPTAFYQDGQARFLISEALRGEGGILRNALGEAFARRYHPAGELAPRDVVTRAIFEEIHRQEGRPQASDRVFLDMTHLPPDLLEKRFPSILKACLGFGVDLRTEWIPVAPAAHYMMGGARVDLTSGRSDVDGLYVVGESVWTGLHGANRLASNSLLECLVISRSAARAILAESPAAAGVLSEKSHLSLDLPPMTAPTFETPAELPDRLATLHRLMWEGVGVIRHEAGLREALAQIDALTRQAEEAQYERFIPLGADYTHQLGVCRLITEAALARRESRGAHYRADYPDTEATARHSRQAKNGAIAMAAVPV
ncbi:MAG: L-aspartate oxidase [Vampirovibrionales bacterium]|nr:L-aspartate oxidase [Vampirovibrionales bacterium]